MIFYEADSDEDGEIVRGSLRLTDVFRRKKGGSLRKRNQHYADFSYVPQIEYVSKDYNYKSKRMLYDNKDVIAGSDRQRLMERLELYEFVEAKVSGDGNCQFRSISDQIYGSSEHHESVRKQVVQQLKSHRELYEGYVPMVDYDEYLNTMMRCGEWGDHVTLQAAVDSYGVKIFLITSFKDTCHLEILPQNRCYKSNKVIFLSFYAEFHYNSIYPRTEYPVRGG